MPFDGAESKPSLTMLSDILRNPSQWPPGFTWNYSSCENCAIGLAHAVWGDLQTDRKPMYQFLNMDKGAAHDIFYGLAVGIEPSLIQPGDVADAIDAHMEVAR